MSESRVERDAASRVASRRTEPPSVGEVVEYVKTYAKQETIDPLKGAGRWIGMGLAGAAALGVGLSLMALGLLRLVQHEWDRAARGSLSWLAYVVVIAVCALLLLLVIRKINGDPLNKDSK